MKILVKASKHGVSIERRFEASKQGFLFAAAYASSLVGEFSNIRYAFITENGENV